MYIDVHQYSTSIGNTILLRLRFGLLPSPREDIIDLLNLCLRQLTFNTTINPKNSYKIQLWGHQFPLSSEIVM